MKLILAFCALIAVAQVTAEVPAPDGIYFKSDNGWAKLQPIASSGGGAKHVAKVFVPGLTPQIVWTFRQAEAPLQFTETKPVFYIRRQVNMPDMPGQMPRDYVIVRFDKKKDHRELQVSSGGNMFTFKGGLSRDRLPDVFVGSISDGLYSISPKENLQPGEYLITTGMGNYGYDFGVTVTPKK